MKAYIISVFCMIIFCSGGEAKGGKCDKLDLLFIIDESGSVGQDGFQKMQKFLRKFANALGSKNIGQRNIRLALIGFSDEAYLQFTFDTIHNNKEFVDAINKLHYHTGLTYTGRAFQSALDNVYKANKGFRGNKVPNAIVLVTDGVSDDDPTKLAAKIKEKHGTVILSVAVEKWNTDKSVLVKIGGGRDNVFAVRDFEHLTDKKFVKKLVNKLC